MPDRLETRLEELGREIDWPRTPELEARPEPLPARRYRPRHAWAIALAILLLGGGVAAAVPGVRDAFLDLFRDHGVSVKRAPELPAAGSDLNLGERVSMAEARLRTGRPTVALPALGRPAVFVEGDVVHLLYGGGRDRILLTQVPGNFQPYIHKTVEARAPLERVTVAGRPGIWLPEPHTVLIEDPSGEVREQSPRLTASTLLWLRGELTLRLEGRMTKERALQLARSAAYSSSSSSS